MNDQKLVNRFGELLSTDLDSPISLVNIDGTLASFFFWRNYFMIIFSPTEDSSKKHPFPCPCTYRTALSYYLDITSNPRTHVLKELAEYTTNPEVQTS